MADAQTDTDQSPFEAPENLAHPQPLYRMMRDMAPVLELERNLSTGMMVSQHEHVQTVLRTPEVFSSNADAVEIGNVRPLIPLQIDPPDAGLNRSAVGVT